MIYLYNPQSSYKNLSMAPSRKNGDINFVESLLLLLEETDELIHFYFSLLLINIIDCPSQLNMMEWSEKRAKME